MIARITPLSTQIVFLVHGINDTAAKMRRLHAGLVAAGHEVFSIDLVPSNGALGIEGLAQQLAGFIEEHAPAGERVALVGFSMGGVVLRYYVQRLGGHERVGLIVTLASPHHGTLTAYLSNKPAAVQMRYGSSFMQALNADVELLRPIRLHSIWTPLDLMIVPAASSRISFGQNKRIWSLLHPWMASDRRCLQAVLEALAEG